MLHPASVHSTSASKCMHADQTTPVLYISCFTAVKQLTCMVKMKGVSSYRQAPHCYAEHVLCCLAGDDLCQGTEAGVALARRLHDGETATPCCTSVACSPFSFLSPWHALSVAREAWCKCIKSCRQRPALPSGDSSSPDAWPGL